MRCFYTVLKQFIDPLTPFDTFKRRNKSLKPRSDRFQNLFFFNMLSSVTSYLPYRKTSFAFYFMTLAGAVMQLLIIRIDIWWVFAAALEPAKSYTSSTHKRPQRIGQW